MLEAKNIQINQNGAPLVSALSFIVDNGQMLCLTGNGETAATIIRALMGLERIKSGFVSIEGELLTPSSATEFRKDMAYLPEKAEMPYPTMEETSRNMLTLQSNINRRLSMEQVKDEMHKLNLADELLKKQQSQLTPQEERMLMLALACTPEKKIILADNPTKGLDSTAAQTVAKYLRAKANGMAAVVVASSDATIAQLADQTINVG